MGIFKLNGIDYMGGGGGNANEQVLKWAEYCALTEEEKTNGTTYYINDINGVGKDQFQPVIYSEEEREIGVWIDARPLYEKTVTFTNVSRTGIIDLDLINVDNIFVHDGKYAQYLPLPYVHSDMGNGIGGFFETDSNGKWIWNVRGGSYASSVTGWMTVRYTKTTDQPGSGTWTPQGVPAVHYDDTEKVVGTWFGETLYEKTVAIPNFSTNTQSQNMYYGVADLSSYIPNASKIFPITDMSYLVMQDNSFGNFVWIDSQGDLSVVAYTHIARQNATFILTLRYTKSTS